jgi:hypothetical protein
VLTSLNGSPRERKTEESQENNLFSSISVLEIFSGSSSSGSRPDIRPSDRPIANGRRYRCSNEDREAKFFKHRQIYMPGWKLMRVSLIACELNCSSGSELKAALFENSHFNSDLSQIVSD